MENHEANSRPTDASQRLKVRERLSASERQEVHKAHVCIHAITKVCIHVYICSQTWNSQATVKSARSWRRDYQGSGSASNDVQVWKGDLGWELGLRRGILTNPRRAETVHDSKLYGLGNCFIGGVFRVFVVQGWTVFSFCFHTSCSLAPLSLWAVEENTGKCWPSEEARGRGGFWAGTWRYYEKKCGRYFLQYSSVIYLLKPSFESRNDAIKCGRLSNVVKHWNSGSKTSAKSCKVVVTCICGLMQIPGAVQRKIPPR